MRQKAEISRTLCFQMLSEVLENKAYSNIVLQNSLRHSTLTSQEKSFAAAVFYGTITRLYTLDYYLRLKLKKDVDSLDPAIRTILRMGVWQILYAHSVPSFAAVDQMVSLSARYTHEGGVRLVNAVLRGIAKDYDDGILQPENSRFDVRFSLNKELSGCLIKWYGQERAESLAAAFLEDAAVTARVNILRTGKQELITELALEGVETEPGLFMENAIRLQLNGIALNELDCFQKGHFMIQDEAAMLVSYLMQPKAGDHILDVCAAPGGKSCHMAEISGDQCNILALDIHESRLELIEQNMQRLGLHAIETGVADALMLTGMMPEERSSFDGVLVDVPCSGLGLILRKPEIRSTMTYAKMQELLPVQSQILRQAAAFVRPGGTLIYSTCTINPQENQDQAARFLEDTPDYEVYPFEDVLPKSLSECHGELFDQAARGSLQLLPDRIGCDGFYMARFRRKQV